MRTEQAERFGSARVLIGALAWRTRREGLRYLFVTFVPFVVIMALAIVPAAISEKNVDSGAASFAAFGARYGAHADAVTVGLVLLLEPGFVALFAALSVVALVRNLIGSEASRGGIEALLAGPYRPRSIMIALLGYVGALAVLYWAGMTAIAALAIAIVTWAIGATFTLTATYLLLVMILPLLAAWAATSLSLLVMLLYPRVAQAGNFGLNLGGGGVGNIPALLPALGILLVFLLWAPHIGAGELLAIAGSVTSAIVAGSVVAVARRFRPEAVLGS